MKIIDAHCDALYRLHQNQKLRFADSEELQTNLKKLITGEVYIQLFAVFVDPEVKSDEKFNVALDQISLFHTEVLAKNPAMKKISFWEEIDQLNKGEIGAILTLEGADVFGNDINKLRTLYQLGVKSLGLTWNQANLCADGVGELRGAGLTELGKEVVQLNNDHLVFTDVSHLSEKGFWDVMELADFPIASHSNSKTICNHRRNLTDQQAQALFEKEGFIGVVYCPDFIKNDGGATISDLMKHIDHFCSLGGVHHICLGSDFDGIPSVVQDLADASQSQSLINELLKHYKEEEVKGFAYRNFLNHRPVKG
ncbi:dipeptidase [Bacillus sp. 03113]|uniref:dipeptidase n=1 Tax=Bacillus sp. 03113 TaxID=2578211 RepID=UPI001142C68A|nr:dipeptidase [Bacillus sp. 03113]